MATLKQELESTYDDLKEIETLIANIQDRLVEAKRTAEDDDERLKETAEDIHDATERMEYELESAMDELVLAIF